MGWDWGFSICGITVARYSLLRNGVGAVAGLDMKRCLSSRVRLFFFFFFDFDARQGAGGDVLGVGIHEGRGCGEGHGEKRGMDVRG